MGAGQPPGPTSGRDPARHKLGDELAAGGARAPELALVRDRLHGGDADRTVAALREAAARGKLLADRLAGMLDALRVEFGIVGLAVGARRRADPGADHRQRARPALAHGRDPRGQPFRIHGRVLRAPTLVGPAGSDAEVLFRPS